MLTQTYRPIGNQQSLSFVLLNVHVNYRSISSGLKHMEHSNQETDLQIFPKHKKLSIFRGPDVHPGNIIFKLF